MEFVRSGKVVRKSVSKHFVRNILCVVFVRSSLCEPCLLCVCVGRVFLVLLFVQLSNIQKLNRPPLRNNVSGGAGGSVSGNPR